MHIISLSRALGPGMETGSTSIAAKTKYAMFLEGALEVRLAHQTLVLEAGSVAHLPKNIPHALRNPLETTARYLFMAVPAGLDEWFDALEAAERNGTLDDEMYRKLSLDHGIEWLE